MWVSENSKDLKRNKTDSCLCDLNSSNWNFLDAKRASSKGRPHESVRYLTVKDDDDLGGADTDTERVVVSDCECVVVVVVRRRFW